MDYDEDRLPGPHRQRPPHHGSPANLAITLLLLAGHASIAAAIRHHAPAQTGRCERS